MKRNTIGIVFTLGLLAGCAGGPPIPEPPAEPIDDNRIVPYSRIGKLALGMSEATLFKLMGEPSETHCIGTKTTDGVVYQCEGDNSYRYGDLWVHFKKGKVYSISTLSGRFATADGISVGSPELKVRAAWGQPTRMREMGPCGDPYCNTTKVEYVQYCFSNGMNVDIDHRTRAVTLIEVYYRGCKLP